MKKVPPRPAPGKWPIHARLCSIFTRGGLKPWSPARLSLLKIACEEAACKFISCVETSALKHCAAAEAPRATAECIDAVLLAIRDARLPGRPLLRTTINSLKKLSITRDKDVRKDLERLLADPDLQPVVLASILEGARTAEVIQVDHDEEGWCARVVGENKLGPWCRGECDWLFALAAEPGKLKRAVTAAMKKLAEKQSPARDNLEKFKRALRETRKSPTSERFDNAVSLAKDLGPETRRAVYSIFRRAAKESLRRGGTSKALCGRVRENPCSIEFVASKIAKILKSQRGRKSNIRMKILADLVASAYQKLTKKEITYTTTTGGSRSGVAGERTGIGLEFMHLAMKMMDAGVDASAAQEQIDRIRSWSPARKKRNGAARSI